LNALNQPDYPSERPIDGWSNSNANSQYICEEVTIQAHTTQTMAYLDDFDRIMASGNS
jgi:hypothetical protein